MADNIYNRYVYQHNRKKCNNRTCLTHEILKITVISDHNSNIHYWWDLQFKVGTKCCCKTFSKITKPTDFVERAVKKGGSQIT